MWLRRVPPSSLEPENWLVSYNMVLSIFVSPERPKPSSTGNTDAHAVALSSSSSAARLPIVVDPLDRRILDYVGGERVGFAVRSWTLVNDITKVLNPSSEAERRGIVTALLQRLKALLHSKVIRRAGRVHVYLHVEGQPAPLSPFARNIPRRRRRVRRRQVSPNRVASMATAHNSVSVTTPPSQPSHPHNSAGARGVIDCPPTDTTSVDSPKTKSADARVPVCNGIALAPAPQVSSLALRIMLRIALLRCGSRLARWRWLPAKKWTGYLHGQRCWVGRRVMMPDGMRGALISARRGRATVFADSRRYLAESRVHKLHERELVLLKLPHAVMLGSLKRGKRERPSEHKAEACRRNGACPARPGSRPRGRPRKALRASPH